MDLSFLFALLVHKNNGNPNMSNPKPRSGTKPNASTGLEIVVSTGVKFAQVFCRGLCLTKCIGHIFGKDMLLRILVKLNLTLIF